MPAIVYATANTHHDPRVPPQVAPHADVIGWQEIENAPTILALRALEGFDTWFGGDKAGDGAHAAAFSWRYWRGPWRRQWLHASPQHAAEALTP